MIPILTEDGELIEVNMAPEKIATSEGSLAEAFKKKGIDNLPIDKQQKVFKDALKVVNKFKVTKGENFGVEKQKLPQEITFASVKNNGEINLVVSNDC